MNSDATRNSAFQGVPRYAVHTETKLTPPSRLRRRGRKPKWTDERLKAMGMTDDEITLYNETKDRMTVYEQVMKENRQAKAAGLKPPHSLEALKEPRRLRAVYLRMLRLAETLQSGDPDQIRKARQSVEREYRPHVYTDEELMRGLGDVKEVERYKRLIPLVNEWNKLLRESRGLPEPIWRTQLTPEQKALDEAHHQYQHLSYIIRTTLKDETKNRPLRKTRTYKDAVLKEILSLESLADLNKGRWFAAEYQSRRKTAAERKVHPATLPPEVRSPHTHSQVLIGIQLYQDMLAVVHAALDAAHRGQPAVSENHAAWLAGRGKLFTPEEEQRIKQVLDLDEIEELMDGKRAERDLPRLQADIETARRDRRDPLVSQEELDDLRVKMDRYKELEKIVAERHAQRLQIGQDATTAGSASKETGSKKRNGRRRKKDNNQLNDGGVSSNQPQSPRHQTTQQPPEEEEDRPDDLLKFVANRASITDQMRARLPHLNTQWRDVPRTITSGLTGGLQQKVFPWIGSLAGNGRRVPAGIRAPVAI